MAMVMNKNGSKVDVMEVRETIKYLDFPFYDKFEVTKKQDSGVVIYSAVLKKTKKDKLEITQNMKYVFRRQKEADSKYREFLKKKIQKFILKIYLRQETYSDRKNFDTEETILQNFTNLRGEDYRAYFFPELYLTFNKNTYRFERDSSGNMQKLWMVEQPNIIFMEEIEGETLETLIQNGKTFSLEEFEELIENLLDAFSFMNNMNKTRGVKELKYIHRDVKPGNLIFLKEPIIVKNHLTGENRKILVKVIDFGDSKIENRNDTNVDRFDNVGTSGYISPERWHLTKNTKKLKNIIETNERADIYGLCMTLYELVTGINPHMVNDIFNFDAEINFSDNFDKLRVPIPEILFKMIMKGISKHHKNGYSNIDDFYKDFKEYKKLKEIKINILEKVKNLKDSFDNIWLQNKNKVDMEIKKSFDNQEKGKINEKLINLQNTYSPFKTFYNYLNDLLLNDQFTKKEGLKILSIYQSLKFKNVWKHLQKGKFIKNNRFKIKKDFKNFYLKDIYEDLFIDSSNNKKESYQIIRNRMKIHQNKEIVKKKVNSFREI